MTLGVDGKGDETGTAPDPSRLRRECGLLARGAASGLPSNLAPPPRIRCMNPAELRLLVERVTAALGPGATGETVERVVRAVVDGRPGRSAEPPLPALSIGEGPITGRIIVTAFGCDRPGILAAVSSELRDLGVNVLDVSQKILQGYFTLIMLADLSDSGATVREVQDRLVRHGDALDVRILVQHEEIFEAMNRP